MSRFIRTILSIIHINCDVSQGTVCTFKPNIKTHGPFWGDANLQIRSHKTTGIFPALMSHSTTNSNVPAEIIIKLLKNKFLQWPD